MAVPKVAVVGSCVTRDAFNSRFAPRYKSKVELAETIYQSSLPSLAREQAVARDVPTTVRPTFYEVIRKEYSGKNLSRLALAAADVMVVDFFADIHFGVTQLDGLHTTRNHMAFYHVSHADAFFKDEDSLPPQRMRYEAGDNACDYRSLAITSMERVLDAISSQRGSPLIVLNSARMSSEYREDGDTHPFSDIPRLRWKNDNWDEMDGIFQQLASCARIQYPDGVLIGDASHPWGKHPVHYGQSYYDHFWNSFDAILK